MYPVAQSFDQNRIPAGALYLGLAGVLPFWLVAVLSWSHSDPVSNPQAAAVTIAYGAIILSFLGGIRWGPGNCTRQDKRSHLDVDIELFAGGAAGFASMFLPPIVALAVLISGFLLQALWDVVTADAGRLPQWFATLRMMLTALVVPALLMLLAKTVITLSV